MSLDVPPEIEELVKNSPPAHVLASQLPKAHGVSISEMNRLLNDRWTADGEDWRVVLNGSGRPQYWTGETWGGPWPTPSAVEIPPGCHFVTVDEKAIVLCKPDGHEFFVDRDATRHWEEAVIRELHARLDVLGLDVPPVEKFLLPREVDDA